MRKNLLIYWLNLVGLSGLPLYAQLQLEVAFANLQFNKPVDLQNASARSIYRPVEWTRSEREIAAQWHLLLSIIRWERFGVGTQAIADPVK